MEGAFGNIKNPNAEGVCRGFVQVVGIPIVTLAIAWAAALYNIRTVEEYYRTRRIQFDHPLLNHVLSDNVVEVHAVRGQEVYQRAQAA